MRREIASLKELGDQVVDMIEYEEFEVAVPGGRMAVGRWGNGAEVVWGGHGLTSNHLSFMALARALGPNFTLVAPDLRGRAGSAALPAPFGLSAHAEDVVAVLDHLGLDRAVLVGHALGGYVAAAVAAHYPERVRALLVLDGGLPFQPPPEPGVDVAAQALAGIQPALDRLDLTFDSVEDYLDLWRRNRAVGPYWNDVLDATYRRDLKGPAGELRPSSVREAVIADCIDQVGGSFATADGLKHPVTLAWADRNLMDVSPGFYTETIVRGWLDRLPQLRAVCADSLNHQTLLMTDDGARLVSELLNELLADL